MASGSLATTASADVPRRWLSREFLYRVALCGLGVGLCYLFQWHWLRAATCTANLALDRWFGVRLERLSPDTVLWNGGVYRYVIACTFADVWCGAIAWVWDFRRTLARNVRVLLGFAMGLFMLNILRLTLSDVLVAHGVPWWLGHSVVAGICYFAIWASLDRARLS